MSYNSATSALHAACLALGISSGDIVWTSPLSFVASANAAVYCGAQVNFVDIDPVTRNICPQILKQKLKEAEKSQQIPKALILVHFAGLPCDLKLISEICEKYNISIIEDASHALGAKYNGTTIGDCQYSDITVFSFHPVKMITSAEGGMATTNCKDLNKYLRLAQSHGVTRDQNLFLSQADGPWYYEQISLGYNYRLSDLHAALGVSQMRKLDHFVNRRNQ